MSVYLKNPVWQPADDVGSNDRKDHLGDLPVRLLLLLRPLSRPGRLQSNNNEGVEDGDECCWNGESDEESVPDEYLGRQIGIVDRPLDDARLLVSVQLRVCVQVDGYHDDHRRHPDPNADPSRHDRGSIPDRADRVADGQVPVGAHHRQGEEPGERVDGGENVEDLAHDDAEDPLLADDGDKYHRQTDQVQHVRDGQVANVLIRDGLHLGEAQDDVDDESVADGSGEEDESVDAAEDGVPGNGHREIWRLAVVVDVKTTPIVLVDTKPVISGCSS